MIVTATDYLNYGIYLARKGEEEEAIVAFCQAIQLEPKYAKAYNNLGLLLQEKKRLAEAKACLQRSIDLAPDDPVSYNNMGLILLDMRQLKAAKTYLLQAVKLAPQRAEVYNNLGLVYEADNQFGEAENFYRHAISLKPNYVQAYLNLGTLLETTKKLFEAEIYLEKAVKLCPGYSNAIFALATLQLLAGRYESGWEMYDNFRLQQSTHRAQDICRWQGENLANKKILLFYEQGFGDTIQFVRYVNMVAPLALNVVLWVQQPLKELLTSSYPNLTVYAGACLPTGYYDYACSLMSLPRVFHTTAESVPNFVPYIQPSVNVVQKWKTRLATVCNFVMKKVGIVWAGNPQHHNDRNRSIPFKIFSDLLRVGGVNWVSLQVGSRAIDLIDTPIAVIDYSGELVDFSQTSGLIVNLDLVITVDSAVAHLAGAMGKKTWILVPFSPDWRWQLEREDSPWYPQVTLFRQTAVGDWSGVLERLKIELENFKNASSQCY